MARRPLRPLFALLVTMSVVTMLVVFPTLRLHPEWSSTHYQAITLEKLYDNEAHNSQSKHMISYSNNEMSKYCVSTAIAPCMQVYI